jgi:tetratricopeptide (TPR) repeat protein
MVEVNGDSRYRRLETIRQYGREKLFETAEAAHIRDKHLETFIQLAEQGYEELWGANDLVWINKLELENDNFRSALSWALESADIDPQKMLQLSGALQDFWGRLGYTTEGFQWLNEALKKAPAAPTFERCRAMIGAGYLGSRLSQFNEAIMYFEDSLALARQFNNTGLIIRNLNLSNYLSDDVTRGTERYKEAISLARTTKNLPLLVEAICAWSISYFNYENALETYSNIQEAYDLAEKIGNATLLSMVLSHYGRIEMQSTKYDSAISKIHESLQLNQLLNNKERIAQNLLILGRIATQQGNFAAATRFEEESLQIYQDLNNQVKILVNLFHLGWNAFLAGEMEHAGEYLQSSLDLAKKLLGDTEESAEADLMLYPELALGRMAVAQGDMNTAKSFFLEALESHKDFPDPEFLNPLLEGVSAIPSIPADKAARLLGHVKAKREEKQFILPASERHLVEPVIERIKDELGDEIFNAAITAGMQLTYPQVIDEAIQVLNEID